MNPFSELFRFALQLIISGSIYCIYLVRRPQFLLRLTLTSLGYLSAAALFPEISWEGGGFAIPLAAFFLFCGFLRFVFVLDVKTLCFVGMVIFSTQHTIVCLADTLCTLLSVSRGTMTCDLLNWLCFAVLLPLFYLCFGNRMRHMVTTKMQSPRLILTATLIFLLVWVLRVLSILHLNPAAVDTILVVTLHLYSAVGCFTALLVLFSSNREGQLLDEKQLVERLLMERETQQRFLAETIDLVNMKCHDMKHQVALLRRENGGEEAEQALQKLEKTVDIYGSFAHTGNKTVDAILTEKGLYCESHGISLNCMATGKELSFLETADLYSLLGNILENAIEAVEHESEDRRVITFQMFRKMNFLCIHEENYCANPPILRNGIPQTSKNDTSYHGFGIKSIQYIAEKYGGNLTLSSEEHSFQVDVLIPIPDSIG